MSCFGSRRKVPKDTDQSKLKGETPADQSKIKGPTPHTLNSTLKQSKTGSKIKQGDNNQSALKSSNGNKPKSKIIFTAYQYDDKPLENIQKYVQTRKFAHFVNDNVERQQDYSHETHQVKQSRLIQKKEVLNYDLDQENGVSQIPIINTFHYHSQLHHCFPYQYQSPPTSENEQNVKKSAYRVSLDKQSRSREDYRRENRE